ncbi:ferredoxin-type protein NapF [Dongia sp.]|uniref:ferredoxin-type protein NapF n=1 Tax=Dongia sp. TaxID=1977262 RepID=UPI0035B34BAD
MDQSGFDPSRRAFLLGRQGSGPSKPKPVRPPWSLVERDFAAHCSGCGACIDACAEGIVFLDADKKAAIDFRRGAGACTFCGGCAEACNDGAFMTTDLRCSGTPWSWRAVIADTCLAQRGIACQSCKDACPADAIAFRYQAGGVATPDLALARCDGCGGCVAPCPAEAISLVEFEVAHA